MTDCEWKLSLRKRRVAKISHHFGRSRKAISRKFLEIGPFYDKWTRQRPEEHSFSSSGASIRGYYPKQPLNDLWKRAVKVGSKGESVRFSGVTTRTSTPGAE